jgi:enoyl-CoA hydratase
MTSENIEVTSDQDGVVLITLNRPGRGNAITLEMLTKLDALIRHLEQTAGSSADRRALVIAGAGGKFFSAGADLSEMASLGSAEAGERMRRGQAVFERIEALPLVVIAAIEGYALGGGLELAMSADIRIATPDSVLGQPEITLSHPPGWGGTARLASLVGVGRAMSMVLTGQTVDGTEALRIGLVSYLDTAPISRAIELGRGFGKIEPMAVAYAKRAVRAGVERGRHAAQQLEALGVAACTPLERHREALKKYLKPGVG